MSNFVTLAQGKAHLRIPLSDTSEDTDLQAKLDAAEAVILDYIKTPAPDPSALIPAAILLQFGELYRYRGDDDGPKQTDGDLSPHVTNLLRRFRDPALR